TSAGGYTVHVTPEQVDAVQFTRLLADGHRAAAAGDPATAASTLRDALDLWRGQALADVDAGRLLGPWAVALEESRSDAVEARIDADLRLGRHRDLIGELQRLTHEHPLREGYWRQAMLALYRCGRQAEALATYRRLRDCLVADLGLEPGAEVTRLHQAILAGDPQLDVTPATAPIQLTGPEPPAQLPSGITDFTGRQAPLTTVRDALLAQLPAADGASRIVVVSGKAGVGKSALAVQAGHRIRAGFPDGQLYAVLRGAEGAAVPAADVLAWFLSALGSDGAGIPDSLSERIQLYRSRLAGRRMLVVLDDAVDVSQVRPLLPGDSGHAVLVTSRRRLPGLEGALDIDLPLLEPAEAVNLLRRIAGEARVAEDVGSAERIAQLCGQLPLAVRVAGAKLASRPHWSLSDLVRHLTDERDRLAGLSVGDLDVRTSFALSYQSCDVVSRRAFRLLSEVPSRDFPVWVVAAACDIDLTGAETAVEHLVDAQLLQVAGRDSTGGLRYQFHDLFRLYAAERAAAEDGPGERRNALVRVLAGYCRLARYADEALRPGRLAPTGPPELQLWRPPGPLAAAARGNPVGWFAAERTALLAVVSAGYAGQLWALTGCTAAATVGFFDLRSYWDDWRRVNELAIAAARASGDPYALGLARYDGTLLLADRGTQSDEPFGVLLRDFTELGRYREAAHVRYEIAMGRLDDRRTTESLWYARAALRRFVACGDRRGEAFARRSIGNTLRHQGAHHDAVRYFDESLTLFRELGDRRWEAYLLLSRAAVRELLGVLDKAGDDVSECLDILRALADRRWEAFGLRTLGDIRRQQGRYDDAAAAYQRGLAIMQWLGDRRSEGYLARGLGNLYRCWGRLGQARALLEHSMEIFTEFSDGRGRPLALVGLAGVARAEGRHADAVALADSALQAQRERPVPLWEARILTELGESLAATGDPDAAASRWREALRIFQGINAPEAAKVAALLDHRGAAAEPVSSGMRPGS
ncbi:MAG: BTAD domain-containing putative transcriptional regulator, partial [Micromonosporaceae bacterium]